MPGYFWSDLGDMIRSTLVRREEDNDTGISDGGWTPQEVGVDGSNEELPGELPAGEIEGEIEGEIKGPSAGGQGGVEGEYTSQGVAFLPGYDVLEWENVEGVVNGWVSHVPPHVPPHILFSVPLVYHPLLSL